MAIGILTAWLWVAGSAMEKQNDWDSTQAVG